MNDEFEVVLIDWIQDACSCIHHHHESACSLGVISGKLEDRVYSLQENFISSFYEKNQILSTQVGARHSLHSRSVNARTLHVYSPPLLADQNVKIERSLESLQKDLTDQENRILEEILSSIGNSSFV